MNTCLSIGIIGTGFIGLQHIEAIRRVPNLRVAAIADSNADMARAVGERLCIPKVYTDYKEMLNDPEINAIHNCTPSAFHFPINQEALRAGKHVYCEKPLALNAEESGQLAELAAQYDLAAGVNFNYRHNAMVQQMRQLLLEGQVGRPLLITGQYLQDWLMYETDYDWRLDPKMGGRSRAVADIGSHVFDTAQYILGEKIAAVYAQLITAHTTRKKLLKPADGSEPRYEDVPIQSEDAAFIMGRFEGGTPFSFTLSQVSAGHKNALSISLSGSNALLEWDQQRPDVLHIGHRSTPNETVYVDPKFLSPAVRGYATLPAGHPVGWHDAFTNGIKAFYESVCDESYRSEALRWATFAAGHGIMRLVDACLESSQNNRWVEL